MINCFNFNNMFSFGMNNGFMPDWSFPNYFQQFQMPFFNLFDNFYNTFNFSYNPLNFQMQQPLFSFNSGYYGSAPLTGLKSTVQSENVDTFERSKNIDYSKDNLKLDDYNAFKGEKLANIAMNNSVGWTGFCAAYVKEDIREAGLGSYASGHAYKMSEILRNNKNFKEISPDDVDVSELPAGCVLVYDKGVAGYSKKYGHTEITTGDGRAVSDGITKNLYKKPSSIFIPV